MSDGQKTFLVAALLAAVVGVYLEVSHHERLRTRARHHLVVSPTETGAASPAPASSP